MVLVAGASQFLNQATVSNTLGLAGQGSNILSQSVGTASLLDAGRGNGIPGIGLSAQSRLLTNQLLESTASTSNQLFSLSGGGSATVESSTVQINGLKATAVASRDVIIQDDGTVTSSSLGTEVDETA